MLQVRDATLHYGAAQALRGVSLTADAGKITCVLGRNGVGKTSLMRSIVGHHRLTSGSVAFEGKALDRSAAYDRARSGIAFVPQGREIFPLLSVRENLRIPVEVAAGFRLRPWLSRADDGEMAARVFELMDMGGLADKADRLVGELPHGDQRATEIMMALALKPRLLLLDEPTAGMGDQETYDITRLIRRLHKIQKLAIVLIEHDMRVVFHLADRIMVLAEGRMLAEGTPAEIATNEAVQAAYLGKVA